MHGRGWTILLEWPEGNPHLISLKYWKRRLETILEFSSNLNVELFNFIICREEFAKVKLNHLLNIIDHESWYVCYFQFLRLINECTHIATGVNNQRYIWRPSASKISLVCDWRRYVLNISSSLNEQKYEFDLLHLVRKIICTILCRGVCEAHEGESLLLPKCWNAILHLHVILCWGHHGIPTLPFSQQLPSPLFSLPSCDSNAAPVFDEFIR
jgi:hypothetical protein